MLNLLVRYRIITNRGGGIVAGNYINVYWDDSAETFEVQKFDNAADTSGTVITIGPGLGAPNIDFEVISGLQDPTGEFTFLQYRFCDDSTLVTFFISSVFPYAVKSESPNNEACGISVVCDLIISDGFVVQKASAVDAPDGAISVTAESSNGAIKFSLDDPDFDYASQGQTSGDFPGILPGVHTVTAKDEAGCFDQIEITVGYEVVFNVRYRHEYIDINHNQTRIDILERDYEGEMEEVCGGDNPFVLKYTADGALDKFKSILPSKATITLTAETNFKFRHLFSQDDRKYKVEYSKNYGVTTPGFTPDTLDALDDWTNEDVGGEDWTTGIAVPYVEFTGTAVGAESDILKTLYSFEAGKIYTFSYELRGGDSSTPAPDVTFYIQILDASNVSLTEKIVSLPFTFPPAMPNTITGEYTFTAPAGAVSIGIKVISNLIVGATRTLYVDSFENETQSVAATDWELKWSGYAIGDNYSEVYLAEPYHVTIVATDGLSDLKNVNFLDLNENKYREDITALDAIKDVLARTELDLNIQSGLNRYEENMSQGATDDPLNQCKFNPDTYYHDNRIKSCFEVLEEILKPFGGRLIQRNGKWFITSIEEHLGPIEYREFDHKGNLLSNGTIDDVVDIKQPLVSMRAAFRDREQVLETIPAYGKMFFEHTLLKQPSLIASYGFEIDDVIISPEGFTSFKNWNVDISEAPGITYGIKETKSLQGDFNFYVRGIEGTDKFITLTTKNLLIEHSGEDAFELSFDYVILLLSVIGVNQSPFWVRIKWSLKVGDYYFRDDIGWVDDSQVDTFNHIYANTFNKNQNFKVRGLFREGTTVTDEYQFKIYFEGVGNYNFAITTTDPSAYDDLRVVETVFLPVGHKLRGSYTAEAPSNISNRYYTLESGTKDDESIPDIILPDDYDEVSNPRYWRLEQIDTSWRVVEFIYLDNVILLHYPKQVETPANITIEKENNRKIKLNFEDQYLLNDIDTVNINNAERTYKNFLKLIDGTPTQVWSRTYRAGEGKLLDLLANDYASQFKSWSNRLTGSFVADQEILPSTLMNEVNDDGCKYLFSEYELSDKEYSIRFSLFQIADVLDDDGEAIDAGFTTGFSLGFRS